MSIIFFVKKVFLVLFVLFVAAVCSMNGALLENLLKVQSAQRVEFYCSKKVDGLMADVVQNGEGFIYSCQPQNAKTVYENLSGCFGFSVKYQNNNALNEIIKNMTLIKKESQGDLTLIYGRVPSALFFDFVGNQKVNIQIAMRGQSLVVGSPIILGSY